jgi:hypothetical protein
MSTVTWDIAQLERRLPDGDTCPDGAVSTIHWTASLEEGGEAASAYGSIGLGEPASGSFTPYNQLTKAQVVGWLLAALGVDQVVSIEEGLNNQIQQKLNPTLAAGIPW